MTEWTGLKLIQKMGIEAITSSPSDVAEFEIGQFLLDVNNGRIYAIRSSDPDDEAAGRDRIYYWGADGSISLAFSISGMTFNRHGNHLIGDGEWRAGSEMTFSSITYANGPPTSAYVSCSAWAENLVLADPWTGATGGVSQNTEYPDDVGDTLSFKLNAWKSSESDTFTRTSTFLNQRCQGVSSIDTGYDSDFINALGSKTLISGKNGTYSFTPAAGEYIIFAYRKDLGTSSFTVNSFLGGMSGTGPEPLTITHINSEGFSEPYFLYRSNNHSLGPTTIVVS